MIQIELFQNAKFSSPENNTRFDRQSVFNKIYEKLNASGITTVKVDSTKNMKTKIYNLSALITKQN